MNAALLGLLSAAGLGIADFMARFSARALGAPLAYGVVLLVGALASTAWLLFSGAELNGSPAGNAFAVAHGVCVATMCILLYMGLARGPVAIVAPIVAAHPALVLVVNVAMGYRPTPLMWAAMIAVIAGGLLIARSAEQHPHFAGGGAALRKTILIALGACLAYVLVVLTAQAAAPRIGDAQTACIARWTGVAVIACLLAVRREAPSVPKPWLPFLIAQGLLDALGNVAFLAGARTAEPYIAMVVASTFGVFTVLLARFALKEPISAMQWTAITLIAAGTAVLTGSSP